jgi:hypothetical protein
MSHLQSQVQALQLQLSSCIHEATANGMRLPSQTAVWNVLVRSPDGSTVALVTAETSEMGTEAGKENATNRPVAHPASGPTRKKLAQLIAAIQGDCDTDVGVQLVRSSEPCICFTRKAAAHILAPHSCTFIAVDA